MPFQDETEFENFRKRSSILSFLLFSLISLIECCLTGAAFLISGNVPPILAFPTLRGQGPGGGGGVLGATFAFFAIL